MPVVITGVLSTDDWRKWHHVWLDRLTAWAVTGWVPNSKACMQSLVEREKYPPEHFNVIYDGIDTKAWTRTGDDNIRQSIRKSLNCDHEDIVCTTVGNFRRPKGYPYLIEAIHEILDVNPKLHFVFVGKGHMEEELKLKCKKLKLEEKVTFTGYRSDIKGIYEASDIALLPSLYEGLPICLIEAMSMELPVVATKVSGIPELVEDGVTGLLVPPRNTKALSEAIIKLITDHRLRVQMGQAGRQRVCKMFTIEHMIEELLAYYQQQFKSVVRQKS